MENENRKTVVGDLVDIFHELRLVLSLTNIIEKTENVDERELLKTEMVRKLDSVLNQLRRRITNF